MEKKLQKLELDRQQEIFISNTDKLVNKYKLSNSIIFTNIQKDLESKLEEKNNTVYSLQQLLTANQYKTAFVRWQMMAKFETFMHKTKSLPNEEQQQLYKIHLREQILNNYTAMKKQINSTIEVQTKANHLTKQNNILE